MAVKVGTVLSSHVKEGQGWLSLRTAKGNSSNTDVCHPLSGGTCFSMRQLESPRVRACGSSRFSSLVLPRQRGHVWKLQERMELAELGSSTDPKPLLKSRDLGQRGYAFLLRTQPGAGE